MCLVKIGRKLKNVIVWTTERSYKFIVGILIILWMIGLVLNPPVTVFLTWLWGIVIGTITYSWGKTKDSAQWTLATLWQQVKDWREGRRRRKVTLREEEYGK